MDKIVNFLIEFNLGILSSVIGLLFVIIGFFVTVINVLRSKKASEKAEEAAVQVMDNMRKFDTITEFSSAISAMDEIKRLHRQKAWDILPDRYSFLRKSLISIKTTNPNMLKEYQSALQTAITNFSSIEDQVEKANLQKKSPPDIAKLNKVVSKQIDKLHQILTEIKNQINR